MEKLTTIYQNNSQAAHEVHSYVKDLWSFSLRPFNRFDPLNTEWWLVHGSEWPAYKFGKLCFHRYPRTEDGYLFPGYYVEKGLGHKLLRLPGVQKRSIMQANWYWHKFIKRAEKGDVEQTIAHVSELAQADVWILIELHAFNKVPTPDKARSVPTETLEFKISFPGLEWHSVQTTQNKDLLGLNNIVSIGGLVKEIEQAKRVLDYFWADLIIGIRLSYADERGWDASDLWRKALAPWLSFVIEQ